MAASPALAQEILPLDEDQRINLDDEDIIIVTGEKIARSLQDTVSSVAVVSEEEIDNQNYIDLTDVLDQIPNVSTGFDDSVFTIRGIRNTGAGLGDVTSDVSTVYVDGVFIPSQFFTNGALNLWDISSVEVFRGPQSTIQGRNALAGAIVLNTIDPGNEFSGQAQISYAEFDTYRGSAAFTIPVIDDLLSIRVSGDYTSTDGFNFNPTLNTDRSDASETATFRGKARLTPAQGVEFIASYTYIDGFQGEGRIDERFPPERLNFENIQSRNDTRADILSFEGNFDLTENLSLTAVTGYIDSIRDEVVDTTRDASGGASSGRFVGTDEIFSQEVRLTYQDDRLTGLLGLYYFNSESDFTNQSSSIVETDFAFPDAGTLAGLIFQTPAPTPQQVGQASFVRDTIVSAVPSFPVEFDRSNPTDIENYAIFGELTYRFTDKLSVTVGARFDNEDIEQSISDGTFVPPLPAIGDPLVDQVLALTAAQFTNTVAVNDIDNSFNAFLPKGVITYDWTEDLSTSFSVQRAYRAGGLSVNVFRAALPLPGGGDRNDQEVLEAAGVVNSFDPEFTTNYEFSLRSQWFDRKLTLNANVFFIDYTDQQVNVFLSGNPLDTLTTNAGQSELFGFEIEAFAEPTDGLTLNLGIGYTDTEFTEAGNVLSAVDGAEVDLTGNEFSFAPRWTINGGARYEHDSGFYGNARFRYVDESFALPDNNVNAINDSHFVADLIVGYQMDNIRVEAFGTNIFDEEYLTFNSLVVNAGAVDFAGAPQVFGLRMIGGF